MDLSKADLAFVGGRVFTSDRHHPFSTALAVRGGRIAALGGDVADLIGPSTHVVNVAGGLVLPGFQDAHVHPVLGGWSG